MLLMDGNHARTLHKWFEFDWFLGLEDLALQIVWVRGRSQGFTMTVMTLMVGIL